MKTIKYMLLALLLMSSVADAKQRKEINRIPVVFTVYPVVIIAAGGGPALL